MLSIVLMVVVVALGFLIIPAYADNYSYSPFRTGQSPFGELPTDAQIRQDMEVLSTQSEKIRVFENSDIEPIVRFANMYGLQVSVGANENIDEIIALDKKYPDTIESIIFGNNDVVNGKTPENLISEINDLKQITDIPVTSLNNPKIWLDNPQLAETVDFIFTDAFTSQTDPVGDANQIQNIYQLISEKYPHKHIVMETGWSTVDSSKSQQLQFIDEINKLNLDIFYFEYTDEDWKQNKRESGFGILTANREQKTEETTQEPMQKNILEQYAESVQEDPVTQAATGAVGIGGILITLLKMFGYMKFGNQGWGDPYIS